MTEKDDRIDERLARIVAAIPGDEGWWKSDGEAFMDLGREMLRLGAGLTEIELHLRAMYWEVASEFGS